jgi:hypothetical protein
MAVTKTKRKDRKPREGLVEVFGGTYVLTGLGLVHVQEMAAVGSQYAEIAAYLRVGVDWVRRSVDDEHDHYDANVANAYHEGRGEYLRRLRQAQQNLADVNAQMAIHLGKQDLNQRDDAVEHRHVHQVVGTMPDYEASSDQWRRQFAPEALQPMRAIDVEDAEVITVEVRK